MRQEPFRHDGVTLSVHAVGQGCPVLWQHGLCGDAGQTAEVFPDGIGWQGLTVECRGHGLSEAGPLGTLGLNTFAADLAAFLETLGGPVVAVVAQEEQLDRAGSVVRDEGGARETQEEDGTQAANHEDCPQEDRR